MGRKFEHSYIPAKGKVISGPEKCQVVSTGKLVIKNNNKQPQCNMSFTKPLSQMTQAQTLNL